MAQASAQEYIFRHKYPISAFEPEPTGPDEIGVGNDIVAYYTAPIGYDFQKRIPVKTTDVANWVEEDGDTPSGIFLDKHAGIHKGIPDVEQSVVQKLSGFDASNNRIAKAEVHFDIRKPQGIEVPIKFLAHKGQYSYNVIPSPQGASVERWDPWMVMPVGMSMRNEALEGVPSEAREYTLLWQGYDYLNRPVAFAHGDLVVTDGPTIDNIATQHVDPARGEAFRVRPVSHNVISTPVYRLILVDGERPEGLEFSAETGILSGAVETFDWKATFRIRVTDTYDGTWDETEDFVLSTAPATFSMDDVKDIVAYRGQNRSYGFTIRSSIPNPTWSLAPESAPLPPGMEVVADKEYAYISGIPSQVGEWPGVVLMVSAPGFEKKTSPFKVIVREQALYARTEPVMTRMGQPFETAGFEILRGRADPVEFKFAEPGNVPAGMTIDSATGVIKLATGYPAVGHYSIPVVISNGDGQTPIYNQYVAVYPDLTIAYEPAVFTRYSYGDRAIPALDPVNVAGNPRFTIEPALPLGLKLDASGRIVPTYDPVIPESAIGNKKYVVSIQDDAGSASPSQPFTIEIKDRPDISIADGVLEVERYAHYSRFNAVSPVAVENTFPTGSARFTYSGKLPEGLKIGEYGFFEGTTNATAGEYPDIKLTVTDGDGRRKDYGPFTVRLKQAMPIAVLEGDLHKTETWPAGQNFKFQLPTPYNAKAPVNWTLTDAPAGLSVDAEGKLTGNIPLTGTYVVKFEIGDDTGRSPIEGSLTIKVEEPFEFGAVEWNAYKGQLFQAPDGIVPVERGIKPFTWMLTGKLPSGWSFYQGQLVGIPTTSQGGFQLDVTMKDKAGVQRPFSTFVKFNPPKPLSVSYPSKMLEVGATTGLPLTPKLSDTTVRIADWAPVQGLPSGIGYDTVTGEFTASPYPAANAVGIHTVNVVPRPSDPEVKLESSSFPATLKVGYGGEIEFKSKTFKERLGKNFTRKLTYSRAVEPVRMTATALAAGVSFNDQTFSFSGRFDTLGSHTGGSIKIEENDDPAFNRERTAQFNFQTVDEISFNVPPKMTFGQYDFRTVGISEILNIIGDDNAGTPDVTYEASKGYADLPSGLSVNSLTGAVEGTPEDVGTFGPFAITAFDAYGDRKNSNEFSITIGERKQLEVSYPSGFGHFSRYGQHSSAPTPINGYGPFTWSIDRTPPLGIEFDMQTGTFTASSDQIVAPQEFTVTVVDSKGGVKGTASTKVTVGISERPALRLDYGNSILAFTRHVAEAGIEPAVENRVGRGGNLEFSISPVNAAAALPSCIVFDEATGRLSAIPACSALFSSHDYRITVTDRTWREDQNTNGKAEYLIGISVQERPSITLDYPDYDKAGETFGFKRHHDVTVYPEWDNPITDDVSWSIDPAPPTGITFNQDGSISVETVNLIPSAAYVVTVSDAFNGKSHFPLNLGVSERDQLTFSIDASSTQQIALNIPYELTLDVKNVISDGNDATPDVLYSQVSGTLPAGIEFDADGTGVCGNAGTFCGEASTDDHGKFFTVRIKATDSFDGIVEKDFHFTVVEDATPMQMTYEPLGKARVGYAYRVASPTVRFAVGNYAFSAPALAQVGLGIDSKTGEIKGTPNTTFDRAFDITVNDKLGASRAVTVSLRMISAPTPTVTVPNPVSILFNRSIPADQQPQSSNYEAPSVWTLEPVTPPPGLTLDTTTGHFVGKPSDIGKYGPYTLTLKDALPGVFPTTFGFDIAMNDDPIELEELSVHTKVGFPFQTKAPEYDNALGAPRFSSPELEALGLQVDPTSGVISGSVNTVFEGRPNLVVRDKTIRTTSMPVNLTVLPRLRLTAPGTVYMTAFEAVTPNPAVTPAFQAGELTWDGVDPALLPVGVIYDNDGTKGCGSVATFCGTPLKAQTMEAITVSATDTFGNGLKDTARSNPINIVVRKGVFAMEFLPDGMSGVLPDGTKRTQYSQNLVQNGMFIFDGMDLSAITFTMEANADNGEALPPGLSVQKNGILSGIPLDEGTYTFDIIAKYSNKPTVRGKFTVTTKRPATTFKLSDNVFADIERTVPFTFDFRSLLTIDNVPLDKVTWTMVALPNTATPPVTEALPNILLAPQTGILSGSPMASGDFKFSITAEFKDRYEQYVQTKEYNLRIKKKEYRFKKIAVTSDPNDLFTCGISFDDTVLCWGSNYGNVLGTNLVTTSTADPEKVIGLNEKAKDIAVGQRTACVITVTDRVACWGQDLSAYSYTTRWQATYVGSYKAKSISLGGLAACMVTLGNDAVCWGYETVRGSSNKSPYIPQGLGGVTAQISVGWRHICATTTSGGVKCWGQGSDYTPYAPWFGIVPVPQRDITVPTDMTNHTSGVKKVIAGQTASCILKTDDTVTCFSATSPVASNIKVLDLDTPAALINQNNVCALTAPDTLRCTYPAGSGGPNPTRDIVFPGTIVNYSTGTRYSCAIVQGGEAYCVGPKVDAMAMGSQTSQPFIPKLVTGL